MAGVKGRSGRKKKTVELANCGQILTAAAIPAAQYLSDVIRGVVKKPSWSRIEVAKFIIDHVLGKARTKLELGEGDGVPTNWMEVTIIAMRKRTGEGESPEIGGLLTKPPEGE